MNDFFPIIDVTDWPILNDEMMGSKLKFWMEPEKGVVWLFKKKHRENSDDDWSEKIASELAELLGIPHATVELANRQGSRGVVSRDLVSTLGAQELIHGNNLLVEADADYPTEKVYKCSQHTVERIFRILSTNSVGLPTGFASIPEVEDACDLFIGYLLFDAWIGNTDRHHQNWGILKMPEDVFVLSPSYDHASALGHNLLDATRGEYLLAQKPNRQIGKFARNARSAIYSKETDKKAVLTDEAFAIAALIRPTAAAFWLNRLCLIQNDAVTDIVQRVPDALISKNAEKFIAKLLQTNHQRLLT